MRKIHFRSQRGKRGQLKLKYPDMAERKKKLRTKYRNAKRNKKKVSVDENKESGG